MKMLLLLPLFSILCFSWVHSCGQLAGKAIGKKIRDSYVSDCVAHDFTCKDCTAKLANRIVRFESNAYPGYWMSNDAYLKFVNKEKIMEAKEKVSWKMHDCGVNSLALESQSPRNYYAYPKRVNDVGGKSMYMKYKSHSPCRDQEKKTKICCEDCTNFHRCRISGVSGGYYRPSEYLFQQNHISASHVTYRNSNDVFKMDKCLLAEWKVWLNIPTDAYVFDRASMCNRLGTDEKFGYKISETITKSNTMTITIGTEIKSELLKALMLETTVTHKAEWQNIDMIQEQSGKTIEVGGLQGLTVKKGKKVVVKRLTGYYGDFTYKTNKFIVEEENC